MRVTLAFSEVYWFLFLDQSTKMGFLDKILWLFAELASLYLAVELKAKILLLSYFFRDILSQNADMRILLNALLGVIRNTSDD